MKIEETAVYTTSEVAELLKVSLPTIKRMLKDGRLKSTRIGRQHRFLGSDILEILTQKKDLRKTDGPGDDTIIAKSLGGTPEREAAPLPRESASYSPATPVMSTFEKRQRSYMMGRTVTTPLRSEDGGILIDEGTIVDEEVLDRAKQAKKLMELFSCLEHDK